MKKLDIKNALEEKFYKVGIIKGAETMDTHYQVRLSEGVLWYRISVYENKDDILIRRSIPIYCAIASDPGKKQIGILTWDDLPDGEYFYDKGEPKSSFPIEKVVPNFVKTLESNGENIERYTENYAIIRKFVKDDTGYMEEKRFYVKPDGTELHIKETNTMV